MPPPLVWPVSPFCTLISLLMETVTCSRPAKTHHPHLLLIPYVFHPIADHKYNKGQTLKSTII